MGLLSSIIRCGIDQDRNGKGKNMISWRVFSLKELKSATNNFNHDNKLGHGGSGEVFLGKLRDGSQIAVKKSNVRITKPELEFAVEVEILDRVRHKNLMSLRGYCAEGQERIIVYDYMPNASLQSHLHGRQHPYQCLLTWERRMNIAIGVAEGLAYLHHHVTPRIVHRDIKASNVLLDSKFKARVSGFGIAKLIPDGEADVDTCVRGTVGYLAPEYLMSGKLNESCDVYSFGVLLLELASGKKPFTMEVCSEGRMIVQWALPLVKEKKFDEVADFKLNGEYVEEEMKRVVVVGIVCAQSDADKRPTMLEVVKLLKGEMKEKLMSLEMSDVFAVEKREVGDGEF